MIENRAPTSVWSVSKKDFNTYVRTLADDKILVVGQSPDFPPTDLGAIVLTRAQARTIAKRINQCLDATVMR